MFVDIVVGAALVLSILAGVLRGALAEVLSFVALAAAVLAAQALGEVLMPAAAYLMPNTSALAVHAAATVFGGLLVLLVGTAAGALIVRLARKRGKHFTTPDRLVGGALGGCRAIFIWFLAAAFVPPQESAPPVAGREASARRRADSSLARQMRQSFLLSSANRANPLLRVPFIRDLRTFESILADRSRQAEFLALPETGRFLGHPQVQAAVQDPRVRDALARGDLGQLLRCPSLHAALLDTTVLASFREALAAYRRRHG